MVASTAKYEVLELLGSGGFGTVYRARYLGEGGFTKEVALKFLNAPLAIDAELTARLRDEARVLGLLRHRAILHVDTLTQIEGQWTIVMEYVEGHDLAAIVRRGPVPPSVAIEIVAEVASALHAAYTRAGPNGQPLNLVHQDLKPSNIRLTPHGEVKVLDFGIARADFENREVAGSSHLGTVAYMAPERFDQTLRCGTESDIYSLGAVLFELLTGQPLGPTRASTTAHGRTQSLAADALERLCIPPEISEIVQQMLAHDPAARPTADTLETKASAIARRLSGESLRAWAIRIFPKLEQAAPGRGARTGAILATLQEEGVNPHATLHTGNAPSAETWDLKSRVHDAPAPVPVAPTPPSPPPVLQTEPPPKKNRIVLPFFGSLAAIIAWALSRPDADTSGVPTASAPPAPAPIAAAAFHDAPTEAPPPVEIFNEQPAALSPVPDKVVAPRPKIDAPDPVRTAPEPDPPAPDPPEAEPSSEPPPPTGALVTTRGDARLVFLERDGTTQSLPARVPPGTYKVLVSFEGLPDRSPGGELTVQDDASVVLNCRASFGKCQKESP